MRMWQQLDMISLLDTLASLLLAFVLGSLVGLERQYRQRTAGLRTNVLVAVGAALFVSLAQRIYDLHGGNYNVVHVVAYIVSGIGFLGAGVIMRESGNICGINTAATLWGVAAVGAASGAGLAMEAVLGALFVLAANTLLRPLVNQINRRPVDNTDTEVTYRVTALAQREYQKEVLHWLEEMMEQANYPLSELDIEPFGEQDLEISAVLLATSIDGDELDALMVKLAIHPHIKQVFWRASTTD
ncbi:TPA: MgtC/SapB family protein [Aeromonas salmonicida subsp. salmonicida]|uniref:MgtC/SapB family protein n=1 Tax=Aeromonas salmonicida TaxID=645 RepID=UPI00131FF88C|nr:MgtC/SapB family protein [Aeromonas salmonicida]ELI6418576.1 MgtC/SapB family protein [Aeromonas salmonicida subsp. salmonicida]ELM3646914.1 MgtC/SapB family protein [Aeromonas salmonicida subsp. salmonicida]QHE43176.1 MgtC/SapB family protein [Aeromonas salmonicida subsp. salmonicida]QHE48582.1 MgtC/SapB family protein [Aeromonas salmonicida subsp. salmonicida]QJF56127.1 MgtC/SapB family protein [Aeromonas salmonicida subsp. salmonicida]